MEKIKLEVAGIPAVLYGKRSRKVYLYVHGKNGSAAEAARFARTACPAGWQVLAVDLPEHGTRKNSPEKLVPWVVTRELQAVYARVQPVWKQIRVYGVSIGAWFAMQALQTQTPEKALLVSPVVDMEKLILDLMQQAGVTEEQLHAAGEIPTAMGETLSWPYLCWVREHPLHWKVPTQVLYADTDPLTGHTAMERFRQQTGAHLTILEGGEHWFHTELQLAVLQEWERPSWPLCKAGRNTIVEPYRTESHAGRAGIAGSGALPGAAGSQSAAGRYSAAGGGEPDTDLLPEGLCREHPHGVSPLER